MSKEIIADVWNKLLKVGTSDDFLKTKLKEWILEQLKEQNK